jgi:DNA mismatch repair protein MutS2
VKVASIGREGEVLEVGDGQATVAMGALKTRVPLADLVALTGRTKNVATLRKSKEEKLDAAEKSRAAAVPVTGRHADVRGMRADDAIRTLRAELDGAFQHEMRELIVIHGHGTGALKKAVREELESSPYVESFRPGEAHEGGDGVTHIQLKRQ